MFGSQLYNQSTSWDDIKAVLAVMEAGRWTSVYTYDHFIPPWSRTDEVFEHDSLPTLEGWALLASIAAVTSRLELGVLVAGNTYRSPALTAKMAATIDEVSGGRVILGIGAGWNVREHEAYGWEFPSIKERSDRLEEACALIRLLFDSDGLVDYSGRYYTLKQAPFAPKGVSRPIPIMVGGTGPKRTLKTLAMYGDIMNVIASPEDLKKHRAILDQHCEAVGRDPAQITTTVHVPMRITRDEKKAQELRAGDDWKMIGSPQYVIDKCGDYIEAGVEEFCLASVKQKPEFYQELDAEIFPAFD
ncbi:MAG: Flavin-dependent oxidoreductase, luciferase family [Chloroflexi bacterium]|nr:MAG: Flavin-dependent oxidoreductase, luciferase family [Chloroflexota bacterium]